MFDKKDKQDNSSMTFSDKLAKEKAKRKRKLTIIAAASLMGISVIGGGLTAYLNNQNMTNTPKVANSVADDPNAQSILKNKPVTVDSKKLLHAKEATAKREAEAAKMANDKQKGKLITKKEAEKQKDDAVNKQKQEDSDTTKDLQKQIDDLKSQLKDAKNAADKSNSSDDNSEDESKINDLTKQNSDLKTQISKLQSQLNNSKTDNSKDGNTNAK